MRFQDQRAIRRRRKNQGQNYTLLFLKGRPGNKEQSYSQLFASRRLRQYVCPPVELRSVPLKVKVKASR